MLTNPPACSDSETAMTYHVTDLGIQARGDIWCNWRYARHPQTGADLMLGSLANGGFMLIDPRARQGFQVQPEKRFTSGWAIGQAPDGSIYQAGFASDRSPNALVCWNWQGKTSAVVTTIPCRAVFTLDVAPSGMVYLPDYSSNSLFVYDPHENTLQNHGDFNLFGAHIRNVYCGQNGLVYLTCTNYQWTNIIVFDPRTGIKQALVDIDVNEQSWQYGHIQKDSAGRVLISIRCNGSRVWMEALDGNLHEIDHDQVMLSQTAQGTVLPFRFSDGSYVSSIDDDSRKVTIAYETAEGGPAVFNVERENVPLRIFSVAAGGGKVWGSTFIPLTLFAHDPETRKATGYGRPGVSTGESYSMLFSGDKLFMANYTEAELLRFAPGQQWAPGTDPQANPRRLGRVKEEGKPLHRPYGKAMDEKGVVYFSARGDYGCPDSGICRIDPSTEEVTRWIFPDTTFTALTYLAGRRQLLVAERRQGEVGVRATYIDPDSGEEICSHLLLDDRGEIHAWLTDDGDIVYGLHGFRASIFAYNISDRRIVASISELGMGDHCHESLLFGPDDDIWGYTNRCVFAVSRDLSTKRIIAEYEDHAGGNFYRFGITYGADGAIYFPNGTHLMRLSRE